MRKTMVKTLVFGLAAMLLGVPALAAGTSAWTGGGGADYSWFNPDNWDNGVPDEETIITINGLNYTSIIDTADAYSSNFTFTAGTLIIGAGRTWNCMADLSFTTTIGQNFLLHLDGGTVVGQKMSAITLNGTLKISGDGLWSKPNHYFYIANNFLLGDAASPGHYEPAERIVRAYATSTIRGWGSLKHGTWADNYFRGKVIADGWGAATDRELLLFKNTISSAFNLWTASGNTSDKGWYATNRAKLTLVGLQYSPTVTRIGWGSNSNTEAEIMKPTPVNSFWLAFEGITHTGNKLLTASLYATDHTEVPPIYKNGKVAGIWEFTPDAGFAFSGAVTNIFRYDHNAAAAFENDLSLWHHNGKNWHNLATQAGYEVTLDLENKWFTATGYTDVDSLTGFFAIGVNLAFPSPGTAMIVR